VKALEKKNPDLMVSGLQSGPHHIDSRPAGDLKSMSLAMFCRFKLLFIFEKYYFDQILVEKRNSDVLLKKTCHFPDFLSQI
jgi:hypothetical protein